ncbi:chaperone protein DnaJ [Tanacetum coccineum]
MSADEEDLIIPAPPPLYDMTLEFTEAIFGAEKEFGVSHLETCDACTGTGAKVGTKMRICSSCGGRGQVMRKEQTPFGMFSKVFVCPKCNGSGEMISEYFQKCSGDGRIRARKEIKVKIPPRVSKGNILRVAGEGDADSRSYFAMGIGSTRCFSDGLTYLPDIKDGDIKLAFMKLMAVNWAEIPDTVINKTKRALSKSTQDKASHEALANLLHVAEAVE